MKRKRVSNGEYWQPQVMYEEEMRAIAFFPHLHCRIWAAINAWQGTDDVSRCKRTALYRRWVQVILRLYRRHLGPGRQGSLTGGQALD